MEFNSNSDEEIEFEIESWDNIKDGDFALLTAGEEKSHLFQELGYQPLPTGELLDLKTNKKVLVTGTTETINLNQFKGVALIAGSHNFVRNVADYSELLIGKGELKFNPSNS
jgi:hypothetical protein